MGHKWVRLAQNGIIQNFFISNFSTFWFGTFSDQISVDLSRAKPTIPAKNLEIYPTVGDNQGYLSLKSVPDLSHLVAIWPNFRPKSDIPDVNLYKFGDVNTTYGCTCVG